MPTPATSTPPPSPEQTLAWEAAARAKASVAAWGAAALTLAGGVITSLTISNLPAYEDRVVTITDGLGDLAAGRPIPPGRAAAQVLWIGDHPAGWVAGAVLSGLASLLLFGVIAYLFKATKARNPAFSQVSLVLGAIGAVGFGVGTIVLGIARVTAATGFAANGTNADATEALTSASYLVGTIVQQLGSFALGFAFVMIALNAMRVGLLTRFMGVLGIIVGATFVLPLDQQGVIRAFWLVAIGFLVAQRWPHGAPPAWTSGRAEPWPSSAQIRRQGAGAARTVPQTPAPAPPPQQVSAGQRRKKRKKR